MSNSELNISLDEDYGYDFPEKNSAVKCKNAMDRYNKLSTAADNERVSLDYDYDNNALPEKKADRFDCLGNSERSLINDCEYDFSAESSDIFKSSKIQRLISKRTGHMQ